MLRLTKVVTDLTKWDIKDSSKMGFIPVFYKHEIRWAKPSMEAMSLKIPTRKWVEKYGESVGIYVYESIDEGVSTLWWTGFCLFKGSSISDDFTEEYPNLRITHFDESWTEVFSSTEGKERWEIRSAQEDFSSVKVDSSNKKITLNNRGLNGVSIEEKRIAILEDSELLLGAYGATEPGVLGNALKSWLESLVDTVAQSTYIGVAPGSPTSPAVNAAAITNLKNSIPDVLSTLIKISK